eukprot:comp44854_c0_seq1/m.47518 comp44854_c0_seq1/g.47518  ORF comp44854_c0_seq1/g.47518 comp44854_c0_seq1/m.47518 type:complete len:152 (-) comp44854_c0_seq1:241-696(-)
MATKRTSHKEAVRQAKREKEEKREAELAAKQDESEEELRLRPHPRWSQVQRNWVQQHVPFAASMILYFSPVSYLKFLLWWLLLGFFAEHEFGTVYFTFSLFALVFSNLDWSGKRRKKGDLSAYSVFNPNFETLEGTLTGDQIDKEIRKGVM